MGRVCGQYVVITPYTWIENACVEFGDRIKAVEPGCSGSECSGVIVSHGLASAHTHLGLYPVRHSVLYGLKLDEWVKTFAWPWERLLLEEPELTYYASLLALNELLGSGVTAVADMHFNEDRVLEAVLKVGVRADLSVAIMSKGVFNSFDEALSENRKLVSRVKGLGRGDIACRFGPCTPRLLKPEEFKAVVEEAVKAGVGIHTHLGEVPEDEGFLVKEYGLRLDEFIRYVGLNEVDALVAHSIWVETALDELLRSERTRLIHLPRSNALLRDGVMPLEVLREALGGVSLGVDVAPTYSIIDEAFFAIGLHCLGRAALTPEDVFNLAVSGYRAMGFGTGNLEEGEVADIVVWKVREGLAGGIVSPQAALIAGLAKPVEVFVGGRQIMSCGEPVAAEDIARAREALRSCGFPARSAGPYGRPS